MNQSLKLRRKLAEDRQRDRKLFVEGKLCEEEVSLAAAFGTEACRGPLIVDKVQVPEDEDEDEQGA